MRIDPVFLLAPEPEPPSMPTRRAFLLAAGALVVGAGGGGACAYSIGRSDGFAEGVASATPVAVDAAGEPGDAELEFWRGVAQGPLDELFDKALTFVVTRVRDYPQDATLWRGVERMVIELRDNAARQVEDAVLLNLTSQIEGRARPAEPALREFVPMLRQRRQGLRRKR